MAAITWADVVDFAAHLSAVDVDAQAVILAEVNEALNVAMFGGESGPRLRMLRILRAAHYGQRSLPTSAGGAGATAGPVTSESTGGISRAYGAIQAAQGGLWSTTTYGSQYEALLRSSASVRLPRVAGVT